VAARAKQPTESGDTRLILQDRRLCDPKHSPNAFLNFLRLAWDHSGQTYDLVEEPYLPEFCKHAQAVWQTPYSDKARRKLRRLLVNIPPGCTKTVCFSVLFPCWVWGPAKDPKHRFGISSFNLENLRRDAQQAMDLMESQWFKERWPHASIDRNRRPTMFFWSDAGGCRHSFSVKQAPTGKHYDTFIFDDPQPPPHIERIDEGAEDLDAQLAHRMFYDWVPTRFALPQEARKIVVMQRISARDLSQDIIENVDWPNWTHLCLPMEYDPERHCKTLIGGDWRTVPGESVAPIRRPSPEGIETMKDLFNGNPRLIAAQLNQNPVPSDGIYFKKDFIHFYDWEKELPRAGSIAFSWDLAAKVETRNDYTVGHMWLKTGADRYLLRRIHFKAEFSQQIAKMQMWMRENITWCRNLNRTGRYNFCPALCLIEDKANGPAAISVLQAQKWPIKFEAYKAGKNTKTERAEAAISVMKNDHPIYLPANSLTSEPHANGCQGLWDELSGFPGKRHDDDVDAMVQLVLYWAGENTDAASFLAAMASLHSGNQYTVGR
jgi:phage terminase large subunit-like protein